MASADVEQRSGQFPADSRSVPPLSDGKDPQSGPKAPEPRSTPS